MRNIRVQLLTSHLILVVLLGVAMSSLVGMVFQLSRSMERVVRRNVPALLVDQQLQQGLENQEAAMNMVINGQWDDAAAQYRRSWPDFADALNRAQAETTGEGQAELAQVGLLAKAYETQANLLFGGSRPKTKADVELLYITRLRPALTKMATRVNRLAQQNGEDIDLASNQVRSDTQRAASSSIYVTAGILLVAVILSYLVVGLVLDPLHRLSLQTKAIGQGDFSQRLTVRRTDEIGQLAGSFNTMADKLEELRRADQDRVQRAEQLATAALTFLFDPVIVTDAEAKIVFLNRAAEGLWGPSPSEPREAHLRDASDKQIMDVIGRVLNREDLAGQDQSQTINVHAGDSVRNYTLRASPMIGEHGVVLGCVAVLEDVTYLKELDRLKDEFIGVASHELKTPVQSLLLSSQLLAEGAVGDLSDDQKTMVAAQLSDLQRLDRLTRDLLDLTRLKEGSSPPRFELVAPYDLVSQTQHSLEHKAQARGITLILAASSDLPQVRVDPGQVGRVLLNLTENAIRHTPSGGQVVLRAFPTGDRVTFAVEDNGEGIPPEYLAKIFERFVQVPGATSGGAGLGLAIAQTILKAHGSQLWVQSELGKGSRFTFALGTGMAKPEEETH